MLTPQLETIVNETNPFGNSLDITVKDGFFRRGINRIKNKVIIFSALALAFIAGCSMSEYSNSRPLELGYEYWNLRKLNKYEHETHPNDKSFLPGSPGSTQIKHGHFFKISKPIYLKESYPRIYGQVSLLLGYGEDRHKNDNDPRPTGHHSAVYSKLFPLAPQVGLGAEYNIREGLDIGVEATGTAFFIESGWDRWGRDQATDRDTELLYTIGPVIKLFNEDSLLKLRAARVIDNDSWLLSAGVSLRF